VATDSITGLEVIFDKGDIVKAIRASISFPGIFVPVYYEGMFLIDGGVKILSQLIICQQNAMCA